jgi:hypothetical protein
MLGRFATGWELAKQSGQVLKLDKELLLFPLMSGLACLAVIASFAVPLWGSGYAERLFESEDGSAQLLIYALLFLFYLANYLVVIFFNTALVGCAIIRFKGGDPTLGDGISAASERFPQVFAWALTSATVGMVLKAIESRSERAGQFVAGLLGTAWTIATYFVIPVLVIERLGPIAAAKRSVSILKQTWGEAASAHFGLGVITFLSSAIAAIPLVAGALAASAGHALLGGLGITVGVVLLLSVSLVSSALQAILLAALYLYAAEGQVPGPFSEETFRNAFGTK